MHTATAIARVLLGYLLGCALCVLLTPVEWELAGRVLVGWYVGAGPLGVFMLCAILLEAPAHATSMWPCAVGLLAPVALWRTPHLRPAAVAFAVGWVGTSGIYWAAVASI